MDDELLNERLNSATANLTLHAMRGEYKDGVTLQAIEEELSSSDSFWALFESLKIATSPSFSGGIVSLSFLLNGFTSFNTSIFLGG